MNTLYAFVLAVFCLTNTATAQDFPNKTIRFIVPYSAGGGTDSVARLTAAYMSTVLGQQVVVENKPGASANIGTEAVARSTPDGYTVLVTAPNFTTSEALFDKLTWKLDDFMPVSHLVRYANVLVAAPNTPFSGVAQMIEAAKAKPGALSFGSAGTGSNAHLAMALLSQRAGIDIPHIPYKGSAPLKTDLLGNHVPLGVDGLGGLSDLINTGKLKALAVLTPKRSSLAPNIPSLGDIGINDVDGNGWYGALVPASTPPAIVTRLNAAFSAALEAPEIRERLIAMGVEPVGGSSQDFLAYLVGERAKWAKVISTGKIKAE